MADPRRVSSGADHTAGLVINPGMPVEELARASQEMQLVTAVNDGSGSCMFLSATLDDIRNFYTHFYGAEVTREQNAKVRFPIRDELFAIEAIG